MNPMISIVIAAGMLTLTALATLPAFASEEDTLQWTSVTIQCGLTPEAGDISFEARTGETGWAACTVRAFGKEYVLPEAALAKLKGFPLSSLETTHEAGYEELGGHTVHFRFFRTVNNPENKVVTEIIYVSVNKKGVSVSEPRPTNNQKVMYIEHANKRLFPIEAKLAAGPVITGSVAADGTPEIIERIRVVIPTGWEVGQQAGTPNITVTRKAAIPPGELTFKPIPSSPAFGEGSARHAKTNGIRVWFGLEPVGACTAAEYEQRKAHNAGIQAQLEPLRKKIEQIPFTPRVKPSLLTRTPRNDEEKSWLAEYADLSSKRLILPTHHVDGTGFLVTLVQSYYGARVTAATSSAEISAVRKAIETVLVPY